MNYNNQISEDLAYYIAIGTLHDIGEETKDKLWENADLSKPYLVKSISGENKYYIFQIIYEGISIGEVAAAANMCDAPIMYLTDSDCIFKALDKEEEIVYITGMGFAQKLNNIWYYYGTKEEAPTFTTDYSKESKELIRKQWEKTIEALKNNQTLLFDVLGDDSKAVPATVLISTVQDFTWHLNCGATTGAMLADWYGRYKDPQLLLSSRPHSNRICDVLCSSAYFGAAPNYNEWLTKYKLFLQTYSSCAVAVSGVDHGNNSTTWTTYKNHIGARQEPDVLRTRRLLNSGEVRRHAMAGIGYTGSYYITRDTWTNDGMITNNTFIYNSATYDYSCILINVGTSTWRVADIQMGSYGVDVKRLETILYNLYYNPGTIDNTFTTTTENAVKAFQSDFGLYVDGVVGPITYNALINAHRFSMRSRVLSEGCYGDDVAELQRRLNRFKNYQPGYNSLPTVVEDGYFGPYTKAAVMAFQQIAGLYVDGIVGTYTYTALLN